MKDDPEPMVGSGSVADRAERLTRTIRDQSSPNLRPRDSATLILIDRSGNVPKVLLGRRHERHRFLPGKFVFPGGRVEIKDRLMPTAAPLDGRDSERLMRRVKRPSLAKAAAFARRQQRLPLRLFGGKFDDGAATADVDGAVVLAEIDFARRTESGKKKFYWVAPGGVSRFVEEAGTHELIARVVDRAPVADGHASVGDGELETEIRNGVRRKIERIDSGGFTRGDARAAVENSYRR